MRRNRLRRASETDSPYNHSNGDVQGATFLRTTNRRAIRVGVARTTIRDQLPVFHHTHAVRRVERDVAYPESVLILATCPVMQGRVRLAITWARLRPASAERRLRLDAVSIPIMKVVSAVVKSVETSCPVVNILAKGSVMKGYAVLAKFDWILDAIVERKRRRFFVVIGMTN